MVYKVISFTLLKRVTRMHQMLSDFEISIITSQHISLLFIDIIFKIMI